MPFAFTLVDDTDGSYLETVKPMYDLLAQLGLYSTKTVWPLACLEADNVYRDSDTLQRLAYAEWIKELQNQGFEIAFHGASAGSNLRARTLEGLDVFAELLGKMPDMHINHHKNQDNLYWADARFNSPLLRGMISLNRWRRGLLYSGENPESPYFWGDICQQHIRYSRNLTFIKQVNISAVNPTLPYADPDRPYVPRWFSSVDAGDPQRFLQLMTETRIQQLIEQQGVCILYVHFGQGFVENGQVLPKVEQVLRRIASESSGIFLPASRLLDQRCPPQKIAPDLSTQERQGMEYKWLAEKIRSGGTS